ncbi:sensor histidine kinase [Saccharothrix obliqua]|uniref:sensor histidine kinase n=1 Tax=Saccharothrix obliqua TaxID=2861747 RepID=UPI001C5EE8A0|nr:sensor histidine kinase [Saccharothrix obliqua]MBW4718629.1 sensor histidine kinase [Saccharothrix obliqua]
MSAIPETSTANPFVHPALFYADDAEYLGVLVPFVTDGLALGHPVAAALPPDRLRLLRAALGDAARRVELIDMAVAGGNPGRIIPSVLLRFADAHRDRHVRIIGEPIWPGRTATEYPACAQHEALINHAFAGRDVSIVCPYDTSGLDPFAVADARATHPVVWEVDRRYPSAAYAPDDVIDRYNQPLPDAPGAAEFPVATTADIRPARHWAAERARLLGLGADRLADLELIATELLTNSLRHTPGGCRVRIWRDAGHVVCEVRDTGHLTDPLAGRRPRPRDLPNGRGLLLVHEFSDLVRTHTTRHGTTQYALLRTAPGR